MKNKLALISVYYKEGVVDFAKSLVKLGYDITSTGGTLKMLRENGIDAIDVTELTNFEEILDGRVKTLAPQIFAGILYRRDKKDHVETVESKNIRPIDMVVNVLYPFEETVANKDSTEEEIIEKIDIGGPSMIRAAAKNHKDVIIVTSNKDYNEVIEKISSGKDDYNYRKELAKRAFIRTCKYEIAISNYFMRDEGDFKDNLLLGYEKEDELRYGENPHQKAAFYKPINDDEFEKLNIIQGKKLSYNNMLDISSAIDFMKNFTDENTVIGIKHLNPCAIASDSDLETAYDKCIKGDSESIFGGIVALNGEVTKSLAEKMTSFFLEIVIAPSFTEEAIEVFTKKKT